MAKVKRGSMQAAGIQSISRSIEQEITDLHKGIAMLLEESIEKAIRIGTLLSEKKAALGHGAFIPWIRGNLPFDERQAQRYLRAYEFQDQVRQIANTTPVSHLKTILTMISVPKMNTVSDKKGVYAHRSTGNPQNSFLPIGPRILSDTPNPVSTTPSGLAIVNNSKTPGQIAIGLIIEFQEQSEKTSLEMVKKNCLEKASGVIEYARLLHQAEFLTDSDLSELSKIMVAFKTRIQVKKLIGGKNERKTEHNTWSANLESLRRDSSIENRCQRDGGKSRSRRTVGSHRHPGTP